MRLQFDKVTLISKIVFSVNYFKVILILIVIVIAITFKSSNWTTLIIEWTRITLYAGATIRNKGLKGIIYKIL